MSKHINPPHTDIGGYKPTQTHNAGTKYTLGVQSNVTRHNKNG